MELNKELYLTLDKSKILRYKANKLNKYVYISNRDIGHPKRAIAELVNLKNSDICFAIREHVTTVDDKYIDDFLDKSGVKDNDTRKSSKEMINNMKDELLKNTPEKDIDNETYRIVFYKRNKNTMRIYDKFENGIELYNISYKLFNNNLVLGFKLKKVKNES